jgi:hypothetical protein
MNPGHRGQDPRTMPTDHEPIDLAAQEQLLRDMHEDLQRRLGRFAAIPERGSNL